MSVDLGWFCFCEFSHQANFQEAAIGRTRLFHGGRQQQQNKTKQLIDFRGYPSPQLKLESSWHAGAKFDQKIPEDLG